MLYWCKSKFPEKNSVLPNEKLLFLVFARNSEIMLEHLTNFLPYCLSSGHLWEVKNKVQFHTFSKRGRSCLQEVHVASHKSLETFKWYFGKLANEERWSQQQVALYVYSCSTNKFLFYKTGTVINIIKTESARHWSNKWTKTSTKIIYIVLQTSVGLF